MNPTGTEGEPPRITNAREKRDAQWGVAAPQFQRWKVLFMLQASASILTVVLVAARAVNILQ